MSYDTMDHAGWVEKNIAHVKRSPSAADRRRGKDGRGWMAAPDTLNPFQRRAMTILGIMGSGIYNAPITWETVDWHHSRMIHLQWRAELSTFDWRNLTTGVLLAHDAGIRLAIRPAGFCLGLGLTDMAPGCANSPHPTLEQAVADHRARFPAGHHIHRPAVKAAAA